MLGIQMRPKAIFLCTPSPSQCPVEIVLLGASVSCAYCWLSLDCNGVGGYGGRPRIMGELKRQKKIRMVRQCAHNMWAPHDEAVEGWACWKREE